MRRVLGRVAVVGVLGVALIAPTARAAFSSPTLISGNATVQADIASEPATSANGDYVVFQGSVAGVPGLYRKDLQTGALDAVAAGDAGGASIDADGAYVSFTTTATDPSTGTGAQCSSVYVRDMSVPMTAPGAFTLASALNGTTSGLTYAGSGTAGCPGGGSAAADRVALSGDGRLVAFTVVGASNLTTGPTGAPATPGAQVAVRDLDTNTTTLISQTLDSIGGTPVAVPGGAAVTDNSTARGIRNADAGDSTAAISADGSTVAWLGIDIPSQAPAAAADAANGYPDEYDEPLWRRIADGPAAPIRRVLGGDDPVGPCAGGCAGPLDLQWEGEEAPNGNTGPERGSLIAYDGFNGATATSVSTLDDGTPQLSADGQTVAVLSTAPATGQDPLCTSNCVTLVAANAYVVNMAPGLSRSQALTPVTQWASANFDNFDEAGPITSLAISPEGDQVAFATRRTAFPYSPPTLITPPLSTVATQQLYVANLANGTMELASLGFDGQPANGNVSSPAFSDDGGPLAFASSATNLVYGAESDVLNGSEVFTTSELEPTELPGVQTLGPAPPDPTLTPAWTLSATVHSLRDGSVVVDANLPGRGELHATAMADLSTVSGGGRRTRGSGRRGHGRRARRAQAAAHVTRRKLAAAAMDPSAGGVVQLDLRPAARYRSLIKRAHGLFATITVSFVAAGHKTLSERLPVEFVAPAAHRHGRRKASSR